MKSAGYEVGDPVEKVKTLKHRWNAVYVENHWRLVFPHWAFIGLAGHISGLYTSVEKDGKTNSDRSIYHA